MEYNKRWFALIDAVIGVLILWLMSIAFYGWMQFYAKYTKRVNMAVYTNTALIECAEVIHSIRYWEIDQKWNTWWDAYVNDYKTWLYRLEYDNTNAVWEAKHIYKDTTTKEDYISFKDMLDTTGYTPNTQWEYYTIGVKKRPIRRYVFINNTIPNKSKITCYVRYYSPFYKRIPLSDWQDYRNYERLNFTMTNYF